MIEDTSVFLDRGDIGHTTVENKHIGPAGSPVRIECLHLRPRIGNRPYRFYTVRAISTDRLVFIETRFIEQATEKRFK